MPGTAVQAAALVAAVSLVAWRRSIWPLGIALGLIWTCNAAQRALDERLPAVLAGVDVRVTGHVEDFPVVSAAGVRFTFRITEAGDEALCNRRVRLNLYDTGIVPEPGERLDLTVRLRQPHGFANPGGFDYERWLLLERIAATGYVRSVHASLGMADSAAARLLILRSKIAERIAHHGAGSHAAALITALAVGERSGFRDRDWETFRRTGTSHLVAISGLHVGIVAMTVFFLTNFGARFVPASIADRARPAASLAAFGAALCYAALAGFSVSTTRAVIMLAAGLLVVNLRRSVSRMHALALAAVCVIAADPLVTLGGSFWLSFGAVGTLFVATVVRTVAKPAGRCAAAAAAMLRVQVSILLMSVPVSAILFGEFSVVALAVNLLAIPLFSFLIVPLVLICMLGELSIGMADVVWHVVVRLSEVTMFALERAAAIPGASMSVGAPGIAVAAIAVAGAVLMLPWNPTRRRFIGALCLVPLIWPPSSQLQDAEFRMTILDVGHGLAVLVETRSQLLVYDMGASFESGFDVGEDIVLPALRGGRSPDVLVVSHADNDHSGGAAAIVDAYPDAVIYVGPDVTQPQGQRCASPHFWEVDAVRFEMLHPSETFAARGNDSSCVLRIESVAGSALLTGDIERRGEAAVVAGGLADVDVLVAPHHGSATSSSAAFVAATTPQVVVFSAGYRNRWGFPVDAVVARWCAAGAAVYVTGEQGATDILLGGTAPVVRTARAAQPRYWRQNGAPRCGESTTVTL